MKSFAKTFLSNWKSGLTVALVSGPLSLALAIASGATPTQGIITAFWAGLIGALFGGSHYNIIGPTGALSGILISYTLVHGPQDLPFIALVSGVLIFLAYLFHLDRYIIFIPRSVVHGFTLGVAFIIAFGQLDFMFGLEGLPKGDHLAENVSIAFQHWRDFRWDIFGLFLLGTLGVVAWNKKIPRLPGPIVLAVLGMGLAWAVSRGWIPGPDLLTLGDKYPELKASLLENPWPRFSWDLLLDKAFWGVSLATALVAILETLLSGQIADGMTNTKFDRRREVLGLAAANVASGLFGGIPATAALARTALNVRSGATARWSGVLNALFLALIAMVAFGAFQWLPMVVIASILTVVALGMIEKRHFIRLLDNEKTAFWLSLLVAVITFIEDPMIGILVGTVAALLIFVNKISMGQTEILLWKKGRMTESLLKHDFLKRKEIHSDLVVYKISGTLTYINMPAHLEAVQKIRGNRYVIVSLRHAFYADSDGLDYLGELIEVLRANNNHVILSGINPEIESKIKHEPFYQRKLTEGKIYRRTSEAIAALYIDHASG